MNKITVKIRNLYKTFSYYNDKKLIQKAIEEYKNGKSRDKIYKDTLVFIANLNINLDIFENEILVIMGMSGCGKSTFIRCLNGIHKIDSGSILVNNTEMNDIKGKTLSNLRKDKFAMVFQNFGLFPHRNVLKNVTYGLEVKRVPKKIRIKKAIETLKLVGLDNYKDKFINELSGGMKQRVGIARALVVSPDILLMDEAFSALDPLIRSEIQDELLKLVNKLQKTVVFITHDLIEGFRLGNRIVFMKDGELVQIGKPLEILANPSSNFIKGFIKNLPILNILKIKDVILKNFSFNKDELCNNILIKKNDNRFTILNKEKRKLYENVTCLDFDLNDEIKSIVKYLNKEEYLIVKQKNEILGYINLREISTLLSR